jgi:electron transfer flavoprotein alpha subunit
MKDEQPLIICALILAIDMQNARAEGALIHALSLAPQHQVQSCALIVGPLANAATELASKLGLDAIWTEESSAHVGQYQAHQLVEKLFEAITNHLATQSARVLYLIDSDPDNEEVASRLAARLGSNALGRCEKIQIDSQGNLVVTKQTFGGRMLVEQLVSGYATCIATVRKHEDFVSLSQASLVPTVIHSFMPSKAPTEALQIYNHPPIERHAPLAGSKLVISGGRGIGNEAGFDLLFSIADKIGGAVAGSLPTVDAGWVGVSRQVGQSGNYVRPDIYVAIGISGTPQHMAGIDPHTQIIAINNDPDAPIFKLATLGIIADCRTFLPALEKALD